MIDLDHSQKNSQLKLSREKAKEVKKKVKHSREIQSTLDKWDFHHKKFPIIGNFKVLEVLGEGMYAEEISRKYSISKVKLSRIISFFKKRKFIEQIQAFPKMFHLTKIGKLILTQGDLSQTQIQEFISDKREFPEKFPPARVHKLRFKNQLIQKPSWLNKIRDTGLINGLTIKRVEMQNWTKFLIYFNYNDFGGLDNIEICNKVLIYNFKQKLKDQLAKTKTVYLEKKENNITNVKEARAFLVEKGFVIGQEEPVLCGKGKAKGRAEYGVSSKDPRHIGQIGKQMLMEIKTDKGDRIIDDSPGLDGEEETDNEETLFSYFSMAEEWDNVTKELSEMKETVSQIVGNNENPDINEKISRIERKLSGLENSMIRMADGIEKMANAFSKLIETPNQESKPKTDAGGMYQ